MTPLTLRYSKVLFIVGSALMLSSVGARAQSVREASPTEKVFSAYAPSHKLTAKYRDRGRTRGPAGVSVYNAAAPGVVLIVVGDVKGNDLTNVSLGSGVIVLQSGYILTNWHVVNGRKYAAAVLKPSNAAETANPRTYR